MAISVLVINCGSSSIKYALISERREDRIYGLAENLGAADARIKGRDAPAGLDPGVVVERHRMFNWLIRYMDAAWDDVRTDT